MRLLSIQEFDRYLGSRGLRRHDRQVLMSGASDLVEVAYPDSPQSVIDLARSLSTLGTSELGGDQVLWLAIWNLSSEPLDEVAALVLEKLHTPSTPPLFESSVYLLSAGETNVASALATEIMFFAWDAYIVPAQPGMLIHLAKDEKGWVYCQDRQTAERVLSHLSQFRPELMEPVEGGWKRTRQ